MRKVSEVLRQEREKKGFKLEDVEKSTKIRKEFLEAIEEGKFHTLPSESYALGFVKNYASFLGLSENNIAPLFKREYKSDRIQVVPEFRKTQNKFSRKFLFNTKAGVVLGAVLIVLGYIAFQYGSLLLGPKIKIEKPANNSVVTGNVVEIVGKTDPYATLTVDEDEVYVTIQGTFKKSLYVFEGEKTINVVAKNRFGKETKRAIKIKVQ